MDFGSILAGYDYVRTENRDTITVTIKTDKALRTLHKDEICSRLTEAGITYANFGPNQSSFSSIGHIEIAKCVPAT